MFTKGQKIRVKFPSGIAFLDTFAGKDLTVKSPGKEFLSFAEDPKYSDYQGAWSAERFELAPEPAKVNTPAPNNAPAVGRAKNGRFASRKVAPVVIRNGSLYNVARKQKGKRVLQVARVRTVLRDGTCVCSRHGKKFFANKAKISLAPQSDVDTYLTEAKGEQAKAK